MANGNDAKRPIISKEATITIGVAVLLVGLAFSAGIAWQSYSAHAADVGVDGIHHNTPALDARYVTDDEMLLKVDDPLQRIETEVTGLREDVKKLEDAIK